MAELCPENFVVVTAPRVKTGAREIMQLLYRAMTGREPYRNHPHDITYNIYQIIPQRLIHQYDNYPMELWDQLASQDKKMCPRFTIIVDEAQFLDRSAIETLRYMHDAVGSAPFPIGIVFAGNDEFVMRGERGGESQISAAVADRAGRPMELHYEDISDECRLAFLNHLGVMDRDAARLIIRQVETGRQVRSLRPLEAAVSLIQEMTGSDQVSLADAKECIELL